MPALQIKRGASVTDSTSRGKGGVCGALTDWRDFERLLAAHYREAGYAVEETGTADGSRRFDGGIDLRLTRGSEVVLVQCKHWNARQVPHNAVHELLGIVGTQHANRGILVSSGEFTEAARRAAGQTDRIELIDGHRLRDMLGSRMPPDDPLQRAWQVAAAIRQGPVRQMHRAWWRGQLAFFGLKLVFVAVVGVVGWSFINHVLVTFAQSHTALASVRVPQPQSPATQSPPPLAAPSLTIVPHAPRIPMSAQERQMRLELVRHAVLELDGVTSSVWLPDGSLMIGMGASTAQARGSAAERACEILRRYPEMGRVVEVRDTRASTAEDANPSMVACR